MARETILTFKHTTGTQIHVHLHITLIFIHFTHTQTITHSKTYVTPTEVQLWSGHLEAANNTECIQLPYNDKKLSLIVV